jgi:cell volume regulation protein A
MDVTILGLGALIFLAHLFVIVFQKTRVPDVLLLIFVGLLLGPVLHVVEQRQLGVTGQVLSAVALVTILFEGGTTLDLGVLGKALRPTLRLTVATFLVTFLLVALIGWGLLDMSLWAAATLGCVLGGTSSAVVIPLVRGLKLGEHTSTVLILESALTDVLCIVLVFAVLGAWQQGSVAPLRVVGQIASSMLFAALLGVLGGIAWMRALPVVRKIPDTIFATVAFVFIVSASRSCSGSRAASRRSPSA